MHQVSRPSQGSKERTRERERVVNLVERVQEERRGVDGNECGAVDQRGSNVEAGLANAVVQQHDQAETRSNHADAVCDRVHDLFEHVIVLNLAFRTR